MSPARPSTATAPRAPAGLTRRAAVALAAAALATITLTAPAWAAGGPAIASPTTATTPTTTAPLRTAGTSSTTTPANGSGSLAPAPGTPIVPPPPTGWPPAPTRSATTVSAPNGRLTTGSASLGTTNCTTTFDEDQAIDLLPNDALDTFVLSPWWNQQCAGDWIRIYPSAGSNHYHLQYTDPDVTVCLNGDNDHGTPVGQIARGEQECEPIDPVTEPRSFINTMIGADVITIERVDGDENGYPRRPFTLRQITIKNHAVKLCFKLSGPWEAAEPPAEGQVPGTFCWDRLEPATYDLTTYTETSLWVTVTLADPDHDPNFGIDTIKLNW